MKFILLFMLSTIAYSSSETRKRALDIYIEESCREEIFSGDLLIKSEGTIIVEHSCFNGTLEPLSDRHYKLGSITKTLTAALIIELVHNGVLSLDSSAQQYIEYLPNQVTIRHLLSHKSGLIALDDLINLEFMTRDIRHSPLRKLNYVREKNVYRYSNYGYQLLGQIIEKVTGMDYLEALNKYLMADLNLSSFGIKDRNGPKGLINTPLGTVPASNIPFISEYEWHFGADGALFGKIRELSNFFDIIKGNVKYEEMKRLHHLDYGLGFFIKKIHPIVGYVKGHNGALSPIGFSSYAFYKDKNQIILLSNLDLNPQTDQFYENLWRLIYGKALEKPVGRSFEFAGILVLLAKFRIDLLLALLFIVQTLVYIRSKEPLAPDFSRKLFDKFFIILLLSAAFNSVFSYILLIIFLAMLVVVVRRKNLSFSWHQLSLAERILWILSIAMTPLYLLIVANYFIQRGLLSLGG